MKRLVGLLLITALTVGLPALALADGHDGFQTPRIIEYEAPGAGTSAGLGTQVPGINAEGAVTGLYSDANNVMHGFLRTPEGRLITFEAPGAGTTPGKQLHITPAGVVSGQGTYAFAINPEGAIAGFYYDDSSVAHGFLRAPDGKFTTFDNPDAAAGYRQGTFAANISPAGVIAGHYSDVGHNHHGFVRTPDGEFTNFDAPGAGTGAGQGTYVYVASCINPEGEVTGSYVDAVGAAHGFVRAPHGHIAEFDVPGAGTGAGQGTYSWSINPAGAVTGEYIGADNVGHGFVRARDGHITTFDVPGAGTGAWQGTIGEGNNAEGAITGNYIDNDGVNHGFVRARDGRITTFDVPGAGTGAGQGTIPCTINAAGEITGAYFDNTGVLHAFLRLAVP